MQPAAIPEDTLATEALAGSLAGIEEDVLGPAASIGGQMMPATEPLRIDPHHARSRGDVLEIGVPSVLGRGTDAHRRPERDRRGGHQTEHESRNQGQAEEVCSHRAIVGLASGQVPSPIRTSPKRRHRRTGRACALALALLVVLPSAAAAHDIVYLSDPRGTPTSEFFVAESAGTGVVHAKRCCHASYPSTVGISSQPGSATEGQDFLSSSEILRFESPTGIAAFEVPFTDDASEESFETVEVALDDASSGMTIAAGGRGTVTIIDDDGPSRIGFSRVSYRTFENLGYVEVVVLRAGDATASATVDYRTADATATAGMDYTETAGTIEFLAGQRVKRLTLSTLDDREREGTETFLLELSGEQAPPASTGPASAEIVIQDDESPTADTTPPISYFHQPLHDTTYRPGRMRDILAFAEDDGVGVAKVKIALMAKRRSGSCRWFSRARRGFVRGACGEKRWMTFSTTETVVYTLPDLLRSTMGTRIRFYKAWSRGIDELGNVERSFDFGRNKVRFEIR